MERVDLGRELQERRIRITELAAEVGVTPRAVRYWLAGKRQMPADRVRAALERITARREGYHSGRVDAAQAAHKAILEY